MDKILLRSQDYFHFINPDDIFYCKSDNCYTIISLKDKELIICQSLTKFSKELISEKFIRVSQSYVINVNFVTSIEKRKKLIQLSNSADIPFTITIKQLLKLLKFEYSESN